MGTAVILLALLGLAAIPGSLIPQRGVSSDPAAVARFIQQNPEIAPWLDRLGFFNVCSSPWFAATYLLLLISMTGCVVPRSAKLWRAVRARPPAAPQRLSRLPEYQSWPVEGVSRPVVEAAVGELLRRRFRVTVDGETVCAERGFARELGNLIFHLSLLVLLFGVAIGQLWGFEGRVAIMEGSGFSNVRSQYDEFAPSAFTDINNLVPFSFTLRDFRASFETSPEKRGAPRGFAADVVYTTGLGSDERRRRISPNHPLVVDGAKVFLTGHGYAPVVTVRDGRDEVVVRGPVIFLPSDPSYASDGVINAPDAQPAQLGFEGFFLPTAAIGQNGPFPRVVAYPTYCGLREYR